MATSEIRDELVNARNTAVSVLEISHDIREITNRIMGASDATYCYAISNLAQSLHGCLVKLEPLANALRPAIVGSKPNNDLARGAGRTARCELDLAFLIGTETLKPICSRLDREWPILRDWIETLEPFELDESVQKLDNEIDRAAIENSHGRC